MTDFDHNVAPGSSEKFGSDAGRIALIVCHETTTPKSERARQLEESLQLMRSADLDVAVVKDFTIRKVNPSTYLGKGQVSAVKELLEAEGISQVLIDSKASVTQQRSLQRALSCRVYDRSRLIIYIFSLRAMSHEGRLQVRLAELIYQRSRLAQAWTHLERQAGGFGFVGGPGERQIELDRRQLDQEIARKKRQVEVVRRTRSMHRASRATVPFPMVALVGYTSSGKSTLFSSLTGAPAKTDALPFTTLDAFVRRIEDPAGRELLLSDTVGFISNLPTGLIMAFRATLEEITHADIILNVVDVSDPAWQDRVRDVHENLTEIGVDIDNTNILEVWNKIDLLDDDRRYDMDLQASARNVDGRATAMISALDGVGLDDLKETIDRLLGQDDLNCEVVLDGSEGKWLNWLYNRTIVRSCDSNDNGSLLVKFSAKPQDLNYFQKYHGVRAICEPSESPLPKN